MRQLTIVAVCLLSFAGQAWAGANVWTPRNLYPRPGSNVANITPTTTTGDTQSPTLYTADCGAIFIELFATALTVTVQSCKQHYALGIALNELECTNMNFTALDGAATPKGVQIEGGMPSHIRLSSVTNSDSVDSVQVTCSQ